MTSIGETLRSERVRRNLDLEQISRETKISSRLLEAIETEHFEKLPGGVFTKSFVRQYAQYLGLDDAEVVGELQRVLEPAPPEPAEKDRTQAVGFHLPRVEEWRGVSNSRFQFSSSLPSLAMVVVVMLVCSGVYAWWQRARRPNLAPEPPVIAAPTSQPIVPPAAPAQTGTATQPAATPPTDTALTQRPAAPPRLGAATPDALTPGAVRQPQAPVGADAAPPVAAPKTGPANPEAVQIRNPNAKVHVQLTATDPTWVLVRTDGKYLFSGTLQPSDTRLVDATGFVQVQLGNAGGVEIAVNGKPIGPVGPKGQVRTVQLTSGGFHIVPPAPKPPPATAPDPLF